MFITGLSPIASRGWRSQAQRDLDNARLAEEQAAASAGSAGPEPAEPPPLETTAEGGENPPRACLGEVAAAPAADGGARTNAGEPQLAQATESPSTTAPAAPRSPSPSELGEDLEDPASVGLTASPDVLDWMTRNWEAIEAMARSGQALNPPRDGEVAARRADGGGSSVGAAHAEGPLPHPASGPPPPAGEDRLPPRPPVHVRKGDRWNKPKMVEFLRQLAATHSVSAAAKSVGMHRNSAYKLRARLKGQPFDIAWEAAFRHGYDNLAHAALDRAINGVEVPHYCNGELVGTSRKFDERLTVALLAMRNRYGAPQMGRYGAAAEWWSERWDTLLERVGTGAVNWRDEEREVGEVIDGDKHIAALINKHAPDGGPAGPSRR